MRMNRIARGVLSKENVIDMTDKKSKIKPKRLAKGLRAHIRWLKQEARKEGVVYRPGYQPS
jgi:hypothetical protein